MRRLFALVILCPWVVFARPWQGLIPGASTTKQVTAKFGKPTKATVVGGRELLAYVKVIDGTVQAHFKADPTTGIVDRIDVFPAVTLTREQIIATYGPECGFKVKGECHLVRAQGTGTYLLYAEMGLAVFFLSDGITVQSMAFLPEKR